jgi:hypothetical protein
MLRTQFDRMIGSFGTMMNPWFSLAEAEEHVAEPPEPTAAG